MRDLKHSIRQLWRRPVFTLTAVLTLAIGIGVNAVAFTVVNGLLFKDSEIRSSSRSRPHRDDPRGDEGGNASVEDRRFIDATSGALDLAAEGALSVAWRHDETTETAWVLFVSSRYFSMVDAPADRRAPRRRARRDGRPTVVIGERFWRERLLSPPIAGLTLRLNNVDVSVSGVLPTTFRGPSGVYSPEVWLPLDGSLAVQHGCRRLRKRATRAGCS